MADNLILHRVYILLGAVREFVLGNWKAQYVRKILQGAISVTSPK